MTWIIVAALTLAALPIAAADPTPNPGLQESRTAAGSFYSALTQEKKLSVFGRRANPQRAGVFVLSGGYRCRGRASKRPVES